MDAQDNGLSRTTLYIIIGVLAVAVIALLTMRVYESNQLTGSVAIKSTELHNFFAKCKDGGGSVDVRPNEAPMIIFVCQYLDSIEEYTLSPGRK